jgi:hypothetical protein
MASNWARLRLTSQGRQGQPSSVILDGRTLQNSCESGARVGYDGYKKRNGSKAHMAVDTPGHLVTLTLTPASEQERAQVDALCQQVRRHWTYGQAGLGRPRLHGRAGQKRCG